MRTDKENLFADKLMPVATGVVGDVVLVLNTHRNINLNLYAQVELDFDNLTSYALEFWYGPNADGSSRTAIKNSGAVALATLNANSGYRFTANLGDIPYSASPQYIGLHATLVGTAPTVGQLTAGITEVAQSELTGRQLGVTGR